MIQFNFLLQIFLAVFLLRSGTQIYLNRLNLSYLRQHGNSSPKNFSGYHRSRETEKDLCLYGRF